jgi:hypothetical protein
MPTTYVIGRDGRVRAALTGDEAATPGGAGRGRVGRMNPDRPSNPRAPALRPGGCRRVARVVPSPRAHGAARARRGFHRRAPRDGHRVAGDPPPRARSRRARGRGSKPSTRCSAWRTCCPSFARTPRCRASTPPQGRPIRCASAPTPGPCSTTPSSGPPARTARLTPPGPPCAAVALSRRRPPPARSRGCARAAAPRRLARGGARPRGAHGSAASPGYGPGLRRHRQGLRPRPYARAAPRRGGARLRAVLGWSSACRRHPRGPGLARRRAAPARARRPPRGALAHGGLGVDGRRLRALLPPRGPSLPPRASTRVRAGLWRTPRRSRWWPARHWKPTPSTRPSS